MNLELEHIFNDREQHILGHRHILVLLALEVGQSKSPTGSVTILGVTKLLRHSKSDNAVKLVLGQLRRLGYVERVTEAGGKKIRTQGQGARGLYRWTRKAHELFKPKAPPAELKG